VMRLVQIAGTGREPDPNFALAWDALGHMARDFVGSIQGPIHIDIDGNKQS
jgi:hypothetical protein